MSLPRRSPSRATVPGRAARAALLLALAAVPARAQSAAAIVDTAIARMGGVAALRAVERVRLEMMTQWQRTSFDERPYTDAPSYELHTELRDYGIPAWRNTRRFSASGPVVGPATGAGGASAWREMTDVVTDSVAMRRLGPTAAWAPLNVAYVDERRELFAFAPERVLLLARDARDLRALADTTIGGVRHARVAATIDRFPATLFVRRTDGFLALARYRAAHPNDFGLAPWGEMEAELWYSRWNKLQGGVVLPAQLDVRRVGRPYKRMTVLAATVNPAAAPDSFAVADTVRAAFFRTANRAMHDLPIDSVRLPDPRLAAFGAFGAPAGAVRLGRQWVLLEAGQAPMNAERAVRRLEQLGEGSRVVGALVTMTTTGNGGVSWLAAQRVPLHVAPGAAAAVATMLRGAGGAATTAPPPVARGRWLRADGDSLWLEPMDLPDAPGALAVYVPSLEWAYLASMGTAPLHVDLLMARARERGWRVSRVGSTRGILAPVPAVADRR